MSRRSHRFRATVEVPELGTVEVRGLSPAALALLRAPMPTPAEIQAAADDPTGTPLHPRLVAMVVAGCIRPRLSEEQILALPYASRSLLCDAIMVAHPATRRMFVGAVARMAVA